MNRCSGVVVVGAVVVGAVVVGAVVVGAVVVGAVVVGAVVVGAVVVGAVVVSAVVVAGALGVSGEGEPAARALGDASAHARTNAAERRRRKRVGTSAERRCGVTGVGF